MTKKNNKIAKELRDRRYHQRVVKNKKVYDRKKIQIEAEVVNGICPTCEESTMLVGLTRQYFRCMTCGADLEQHVNGKISYLPVMTSPGKEAKLFVKEWLE